MALGAELAHLTDLAGALGQTTSGIAEVSASTRSSCNNVVEQLRGSISATQTQVSGIMDQLRTTVQDSQGSTDTADWTGANADTFRGAYADFNTAMGSAESATGDAFQQFGTQVDSLNAALDEYVGTFETHMSSAQESTTSMQSAVVAQRDTLDAAMNTGLTVG